MGDTSNWFANVNALRSTVAGSTKHGVEFGWVSSFVLLYTFSHPLTGCANRNDAMIDSCHRETGNT